MSADGDFIRLVRNVTNAIHAQVETRYERDLYVNANTFVELLQDAILVVEQGKRDRDRWIYGDDFDHPDEDAAETARERLFEGVTIEWAR